MVQWGQRYVVYPMSTGERGFKKVEDLHFLLPAILTVAERRCQTIEVLGLHIERSRCLMVLNFQG